MHVILLPKMEILEKKVIALAQTYFAIQTESKLKKDNIKGEEKANETHFEVGRAIRNTIKEIGGIMPEDLPTPKKSLKELERINKKIGEIKKWYSV